jgi:hypothetical protein
LNFNNGSIDIEIWSNSKQQKLKLKLNELDDRFSFNILENYLNDYINKLEELNKLNIFTEDFISFKYKDNNNEIEFYDNKYYNVSTAMNSIIEIINLIKNEDKEKILNYEKEFKKNCLTKKFDIYDFYMLISKEKSLFVKNIFSFKDEFNKKYSKNLDISKYEKENDVSILVNKTKLSILLNGTDIIKNYQHKGITEDILLDKIQTFKDTISKDNKLQQYLNFFNDNNIKLPLGTYIAKSYGIGIQHFYNPTFKKDINEILNTLKDKNVNMDKITQEFSDAQWIYRIKIKTQDLKPVVILKNKPSISL